MPAAPAVAGAAGWMPFPVLAPVLVVEVEEEVLLSFRARDPCACAPEVRDKVEVDAADEEEESTPPAATWACALVEAVLIVAGPAVVAVPTEELSCRRRFLSIFLVGPVSPSGSFSSCLACSCLPA